MARRDEGAYRRYVSEEQRRQPGCVGREGESTKHMMRNLEIERLTLAAMSLGIAQRCMEVMVGYASERKAFGVPIDTDPRALAILHEWVKTTGAEMNEARLRMTRIPKGADLILNKVSGTPGFWIGNVIVMAGVPSIMQAMLDEVAPKLKIDVRTLSETLRADVREGDIGMQLGEIAEANPEVAIGSYPFFDPQHGPNTNVVLRARDAQKLALAKRAVEDMLARVRRAQSNRA